MQGPEQLLSVVPRALSVRELAAGLRECLESRFGDVWVEGEISNFKRPASGHCYFTLKDDVAQVRCVLWRSSVRQVFFTPADGMRVRVRGQATVYEPRGDLQIIARALQAAGQGTLQQAFEALKKKLASEGLFDPARRKALPALPRHIGIVTSGDGAALQDVLTVLRRRYPVARVSYVSVRVQGIGAAEQIAAAIEAFQFTDKAKRPDVLIVCRGGGSLEDLWAFNEELVARAIYRCGIPIVCGVGHETDFSIADFVADVRAATPSMAAELVTPNQMELERRILRGVDSMRTCILERIARKRQFVLNVVRSYIFNRPLDQLRHHQRRLDDLSERLQRAARGAVMRHHHVRESLTQRLLLLDPRRPLSRGYAAVEKDGQRITRATQLVVRDHLTLHFADGGRSVVVDDDAEMPMDIQQQNEPVDGPAWR